MPDEKKLLGGNMRRRDDRNNMDLKEMR